MSPATPVYNVKVILSAEMTAEQSGLLNEIRQIGSRKEDIDVLLEHVKEILNLEILRFIGLMIQPKSLPAPKDKILFSKSGKASAFAKVPERHADAPATSPASKEAAKKTLKKKGGLKADHPADQAMSVEYREKLLKQVQAIIDEVPTVNVSRILDRVQDTGIRLGTIAELLGVDVKKVYTIRGGKNQPFERKFWKIFSKPDLGSRNRPAEKM